MPELANSYLPLPSVDQLYAPGPQQQYSSSVGGVTRVTQTSGSGYRYYDNVQPVSSWMPQTQSQLEPMDSYVRTLFLLLTPPGSAKQSIPFQVLSHARPIPCWSIILRYPAQ
jgi:hypothetical protein